MLEHRGQDIFLNAGTLAAIGCKLASQNGWYPFFPALEPIEGLKFSIQPWGRLNYFSSTLALDS
jgi:hypothetical protein